MAAAKLATRRVHGSFQEQQAQLLAQQATAKSNLHVDVLRVLNNKSYVPLTVDTGNTIGAAYATILTGTINTFLDRGFLYLSFSVSGIQNVGAGTVYLQLLLDGVVVKGLYQTIGAGFSFSMSMFVRVAVRKGAHTVNLQAKTNTNTAHVNAKSVPEEHAHLLLQEATG